MNKLDDEIFSINFSKGREGQQPFKLIKLYLIDWFFWRFSTFRRI